MSKKNYTVQSKEKRALGKIISKLRKEQNISLRKFSTLIKLSPSNISYIENGVNVPTSDVYQTIINVLLPTQKIHKQMDILYSKIRNAPPPDVCEILNQNSELNDKLKLLSNIKLTDDQLKSVELLFSTFQN